MAGVIFAVLLSAAMVLIHLAIPFDRNEAGIWISDRSRRDSVVFALGLVPFAGIAFLWFIGVVRDRIGDVEDRFFATVFLGSGLLYVAMLFVSSAIVGGLIAAVTLSQRSLLQPNVWSFGRQVTYQISTVYGLRMAAVFVASTSTILMREQVAPRWLAIVGYLVALTLLITLGLTAWVGLLFPAWVFMLSAQILVTSFRRQDLPRGSAADN